MLLEPRRALFLSYWGKMLHQIERFEKALEVLAFAAKLDPRDPTPAFYSAVILRDLNRPTEAIAAINRAVALNDNRAVYRSRFLLDRDLASKNIDLSLLYNQLGLSAWLNLALAATCRTTAFRRPTGKTTCSWPVLNTSTRWDFRRPCRRPIAIPAFKPSAEMTKTSGLRTPRSAMNYPARKAASTSNAATSSIGASTGLPIISFLKAARRPEKLY